MSLTSYHCSTPQFFKKTFHCSTCSWFRFQGNSLCPGLLICAHYYTPDGRGLSWIACIRNNSRHVPAFILYPGRNVLFIYLKGLRPLCRHPVTNRLRMRGIYCSLNPYIYQRTYSGGPNENRTRVSTVTEWKDNHYPMRPFESPFLSQRHASTPQYLRQIICLLVF